MSRDYNSNIDFFFRSFDYNSDSGELTWRRDGLIVGTVYRAHRTKYRQVKVLGHKYMVHRIIYAMMYGPFDLRLQIDHVNGDGLDNRLSNLRLVTTAENARNQRQYGNNTSGVTGVFWAKTRQKWIAQGRKNNRKFCLGSFEDFCDAVVARQHWELANQFSPRHGEIT